MAPAGAHHNYPGVLIPNNTQSQTHFHPPSSQDLLHM